MTRHRPPRLDHRQYLGQQRYFLTICCESRKRSLEKARAREIVLRQLRAASEQHAFAVVVYCMMPDHLHVVAEGRHDASDCLEFVRVFKQRTGFEWKACAGSQLWQESFYDHVLRSDESTQSVVRYVLENPVRAQLVECPEDYEPSGSLIYNRKELIEWAFGRLSGESRV